MFCVCLSAKVGGPKLLVTVGAFSGHRSGWTPPNYWAHARPYAPPATPVPPRTLAVPPRLAPSLAPRLAPVSSLHALYQTLLSYSPERYSPTAQPAS